MFCVHTLSDGERRAEAIRSVIADSIYEPFRNDNLSRTLLRYDQDDHDLFGAFYFGRMVAVAGYQRTPTQITLLHIATEPRYRGRGFARKLIGHIRNAYPGLKIIAETDSEAVQFYSRCSFVCVSLGAEPPAIERFICTLSPGPAGETTAKVRAVLYEELPLDRIHEIAPLWNRLNAHHMTESLGWKDHFAQFSFSTRAKMLGDTAKTLRVDVARDAKTAVLVGYSIASITPDKKGEIESIYVEPEYRQVHVGHRLADSGLQWMAGSGVSDITIVVAAGNDRALRFYERLGFIPRTYHLKQRQSLHERRGR